MSRGLVFLSVLSAVADRDLVPQRMWLDRLAFMIPGPAATRWLLLADAACLVALGAGMRAPMVAVPAALAVGFVLLNALGIALTDFYLGLSVFHLVVGITTILCARRGRWLGGIVLGLAVLFGVLT
jgi:hypothetical protein